MDKRDWKGETALESLRAVEFDLCASFWLKAAVASALKRDPVKVANEAAWLADKLGQWGADCAADMQRARSGR